MDYRNKILIVETNLNSKGLLEHQLSRDGFQTYHATTNEEASEFFHTQEIQAIVTGERRYIEANNILVQDIKNIQACTPFVMLNNPSDIEAATNLLRFENLAVLHRPTDPSDVQYTLRYLLENCHRYHGPEFRKFRRLPSMLTVDMGRYGTGIVTDISAGGIFVQPQKSISIGTNLFISIEKLGNIKAFGRVIWKRNRGIGIEFQDISQRALTLILRFIYEQIKGTILHPTGNAQFIKKAA